MREFTFAIVYDEGADPLMDLFRETPDLASWSFDGCQSAEAFWRIERFTGPQVALDEVERLRLETDGDGEPLDARECELRAHHDVVERRAERLVLYSYVAELRACTTVHRLVAEYLDPGTLVETHRDGDRHEFRLLMRSDHNVGLLYDALGAALRDGISFRTGHLRDVTTWEPDLFSEPTLPGEQRVALEEAFARGYYETPRSVSLEELAAELGVPRSTLSYRLRRAEASLVSEFLDGDVTARHPRD